MRLLGLGWYMIKIHYDSILQRKSNIKWEIYHLSFLSNQSWHPFKVLEAARKKSAKKKIHGSFKPNMIDSICFSRMMKFSIFYARGIQDLYSAYPPLAFIQRQTYLASTDGTNKKTNERSNSIKKR